MPATAIIAALPREIAALVHGAPAHPLLLQQGIHLYRLPNAIVVAAGMGRQRVTLAVNAALAAAEVATLISIGLAGACTPTHTPGIVLEATTVHDAQTGERYTTVATTGLTLISTQAIANVHEKARLHQAYSADLVDMEASTVARLAAARGLQFRAIKSISDAHDFELASLSRFANHQGHFRTAAFAAHTALRPHTWQKTIRLGRNSNRALSALTLAVQAAIN